MLITLHPLNCRKLFHWVAPKCRVVCSQQPGTQNKTCNLLMKKFQPYTKKLHWVAPKCRVCMFTATWDYTLSFFSCVFQSPQVLNSNLANLMHLLFLQRSTSQAGEVSQLKEELAASKATFEKRIKDLEVNLEKATSENSELKKSLKDQEENWKTQLATAESKLGESEGKLQALSDRIGLMAKNIWGMSW